jgi:hypothetical protein
MNREECPVFVKECLVCHKRNHFAKVCDKRDSRSNYIRMDGDTTASDSGSEEESDTDYYSDSDNEGISHHSAVSSLDFRRGRQQGIPG